jgi:hypothetical protein
MTTNKIVIGVLAAVTGIAIFSNSSANAENNLSSTVLKSETQTAEAVFLVSKENKLNSYKNVRKQLSPTDLVDLLESVGFEGYALKVAWATVMKESMGTPTSFNGNRSTGDNSYGLFQINMLGSMGKDRRDKFNLDSNDDLFDPVKNAQIAYHMSNGGKDWSAWKGITWKTKEWLARYPD